jgi:hypothetical protein
VKDKEAKIMKDLKEAFHGKESLSTLCKNGKVFRARSQNP